MEQKDLILEEAKNMIQLNKYHDHIVNLQGLTIVANDNGAGISSVSYLVTLSRRHYHHQENNPSVTKWFS